MHSDLSRVHTSLRLQHRTLRVLSSQTRILLAYNKELTQTSYRKITAAEPEEGPPAPPGRGGPHACSGASCCVGKPFWAHQNAKNLLVAGASPGPRWGSLQRSPRLPSWWGGAPRGLCWPLPKNPTYNIVIVLVLCVCTHVYENALLFSL